MQALLRRDDGLTNRQLDVLALCANGLSHEEIGGVLGMPARTVKYDLYQLRDVINARNVTHAVAICVSDERLFLDDNGYVYATGSSADRRQHLVAV